MKDKIKWSGIIYITGLMAFIIGSLDPLEGSVVIAAGSVLLTLATYLSNNKHKKIFLLSALLITVGVSFLFYFSSLGGFGGSSTLSWWWGITIIPYPIGWLISIVLLVSGLIKKIRIGQRIKST